jgi:hypothetical protein
MSLSAADRVLSDLHDAHLALADLTERARHASPSFYSDPAYVSVSTAMDAVYTACNALRLHTLLLPARAPQSTAQAVQANVSAALDSLAGL